MSNSISPSALGHLYLFCIMENLILHAGASSACFFVKIILSKNMIFQEYHHLKYQTVWIQIRPDILPGLIWVQLFAKLISRQAVSSGERVNTIKTYHDWSHHNWLGTKLLWTVNEQQRVTPCCWVHSLILCVLNISWITLSYSLLLTPLVKGLK